MTAYRITAFPVEPIQDKEDNTGKRRTEFVEPIEIAHKDEHQLVNFIGFYGKAGSEYRPDMILDQSRLIAVDTLAWFVGVKFWVDPNEINPYKQISALITEWGAMRLAVSRAEVETV